MRELLAFIDRVRADLADAAAALERNDVNRAVEIFGGVATRIRVKTDELREKRLAA